MNFSRIRKIKFYLLSFICLALLFSSITFFESNTAAQQATNSNSNANASPTETPIPTPAPTPISLSFIITEKEKTERRLREIEQEISEQFAVVSSQNDYSELVENLDARERETDELIDARPSLDALDRNEQNWRKISINLPSQKGRLIAQAAEISGLTEELQNILSKWELTRQNLENISIQTQTVSPTDANSKGANVSQSSNENSNINSDLTANSNAVVDSNSNTQTAAPVTEVPENIRVRVSEIIAAIKQTQAKVGESLKTLVKLQEQVSETEKRVNAVFARIAATRKDLLSNLVVKDSPAIWELNRETVNFSARAQNTFGEKINDLRDYFTEHRGIFIFHLILIFILVFVFHRARRKTRAIVAEEPRLKKGLTIFEYPLASALIVGLFIGPLIYPQVPDLLSAVMSPILLVAIFFLVRQLIERSYLPILIFVVLLYLLNDIKVLTASVPLFSRLLFLTEMLGGIIFLIWLRRSPIASETEADEDISETQIRQPKIIRKISLIILSIFVFCLLANVLGFVTLSNVIGRATIGSLVFALIAYALVRVADSLLVFVFRTAPFSKLSMVKNHRSLIQRKLFKIIKWTAIIVWLLFTLNSVYLLNSVTNFLFAILNAEASVGTIGISLGSIILLIFVIWFSFLLSRLIRFALEEDVYTRLQLADGLPYAASTILHYIILFFGFLLAIAAIGIDLTKFTVLLGAFGVGLGFGLQNIIENFTSGLILLFERPVKVGDSIQINNHIGQLQRIGLRASIVRTPDGAEIIVPNGELITHEVTNWTLNDPYRRIDIDVGVEYGTNPETVIELLEKVGNAHADADMKDEPRALFTGFGDNSLNFQLRVWTRNQNRWVIMKSELTVAIYKTLNEAEIGIPFPQRDLHLKTVDGDLINNLKNFDNKKKN